MLRKQRRLEGRLSSQERSLPLRRTWIQFPAPTWRLTTIWNSRSRGSEAFSQPPPVSGSPEYTHIDRNTHIHTLIDLQKENGRGESRQTELAKGEGKEREQCAEV